ncbi:hypothetical protein CC2G_004097 [Coprinopsis cinerea AmutBmut pab1-1]|nr:hypothetical protein CC2G_004097 [Coprinopsis cinerea AmutBmut pab1-1]
MQVESLDSEQGGGVFGGWYKLAPLRPNLVSLHTGTHHPWRSHGIRECLYAHLEWCVRFTPWALRTGFQEIAGYSVAANIRPFHGPTLHRSCRLPMTHHIGVSSSFLPAMTIVDPLNRFA